MGGFRPATSIWFSSSGLFHMTTLLKRSKGSSAHEAASRALRAAGVGVVEIEDWNDAARELEKCAAAIVVCGDELDSADADRISNALSSLAGPRPAPAGLTHDAARALSHDLRTPLSAMAGWVHLMETGKLDEAGLKKAITRLRGNIDEQVRTIERYLGSNHQEGRGK
jgi:signal transduction histidine kinase